MISHAGGRVPDRQPPTIDWVEGSESEGSPVPVDQQFTASNPASSPGAVEDEEIAEQAHRLRVMSGNKIQILLSLSLTLALLVGVRPAIVRSSPAPDPAAYLLRPEDVPNGFEQQPQRDREIDEPQLGVTRAFRLYARGAPEVPTEDHASILLGAAVSDSGEHAAADFAETAATWARMGYTLSPLKDAVGEEAIAGSDMLFEGTDHPKQAVLVLFHTGMVNATVQWTDRPGKVTVEHAAAIARLMELRIAG